MIKTELSLEVSDGTNPLVMRLFDTSYYCDDEEIENYLVQVLPVNKSVWITFNVAKRFSLAVNSSNLRYNRPKEASQLIELPDGIYEIRQSIKPNIHTLVTFFHLRTLEIKKKLRAQFDILVSDRCKITRNDFFIHRDKLREIDEYIDAAKYSVEECNDKVKGKELYDFASKLLEQYTNECQCK